MRHGYAQSFFFFILVMAAFLHLKSEDFVDTAFLNPLFFFGWYLAMIFIIITKNKLRIKSEFWFLNFREKSETASQELKHELLPVALVSLPLVLYTIAWINRTGS